MKAKLIDGKAIAQAQSDALLGQIEELRARGITPGLTVVLAGDDPASAIYVRNKEKKAVELGIRGEVLRFPSTVTQDEIIECVNTLNADPRVHGILVQLPLPKHIDERAVTDSISPGKDVDGLTAVNLGRLLSGYPGIIPCTPRGSIELIKSTGVVIEGANAVVVGRSNIVGKPVSILLQRHNATVTMCHTRTKNLGEITRQADILVAAAGKPGLIRGDMVKPGAIVIDVGMNRLETGLCGDVVFDEAVDVAGYITPVPGGVGPMTIAMLMRNTVDAAGAIM